MAARPLGQHFLFDPSILGRIASACGDRPDLVLEIGPGPGGLTTALLDRATRVVCVEIDTVLAAALRARYAAEPRLEIVTADVLATDLTAWGPAVVAGNLPYYITSPIIERALAMGPLLQRAVFLVQKEVAIRLAAQPGVRDFGYLTVATQLRARVEVLFTVKPGAFKPPPKVDSAVVRLTPHAQPLLDPSQVSSFLKFAGAAFAQKRKTLRNNLGHIYGRDWIEAQPEAGLRAEQCSIPVLVSLFTRKP